MNRTLKVALVHDWAIHMRGGEKVLEALAEMFPEAVIYTLFFDRKRLSPTLAKMDFKGSFLQKWPGVRHYYRWLLPFLPAIMRTLRVEDADLVISSSHCVAKGISIPELARHICYCHTPMRYAWGFEKDYFKGWPFFVKPFLHLLLASLRKHDAANASVHVFAANSENVRARIREFYGRAAEVVYPPVELSFFGLAAAPSKLKDYYLTVSAFVPYKRIDLVIEAFNEIDRQLVVVGTGPMAKVYHRLRKSPKIHFMDSVSGDELKRLYAGAKAVIFPAEEDFGIVPVEAQACGTPVIAFGKGGSLESVKSGVFFDKQTPESLRWALLDFEAKSYDRADVRAKVALFDKARFKEQMRELIEKTLSQDSARVAL